ncbi:MAG: tetratricopeptide repeat protein [Candidatus Omnitrophica bacterium]|nr:tetratricopeptide repeat protein [Candidatus Omnitrophota bacterium]
MIKREVNSPLIWITAIFLLFSLSGTARADERMPEWLCQKRAGDTCLRAGNAADAVGAYRAALRLNPESAETWFNLAIAHYSQKDISSAAGALENLLRLDPEDAEARYNLACLLVYLGDKEGAFRNFESARNKVDFNSALSKYIEQGLEFLRQLEEATPSAQDLILFLLAQGLPALQHS